MGSTCHVLVVGGDADIVGFARERIDELERRWSRFLPASEINVLCAMAGHAVPVSDETMRLIRTAVEGWHLTDGRYDPTVLGDVVRAGYDRDFSELDGQRGSSDLIRGTSDIEVDPGSMTVTLPAGVGFDPGGIGKGLAADIVVADLLDRGADGACVNLGGDLRVDGVAPNGRSWIVCTDDPFEREPIATVGLRCGAVATSARTRRMLGDDGRHHLIDPASGEPAGGGLASVTVIAAVGWQAEVLAKAAFVAGYGGAIDLLVGAGVDGVIVDDVGAVRFTPGFGRFTSAGSPAIGKTA